ncbi:type II toxin-antitoxin system HicB family antitoxin [Chelativorans sp. YIM 93263]|uniref:type II toxin-antitoxin system HicB family antitoxin n=1 Tax=Chelativorans sp. YIM 93263 TaxID=2906648 RepID=UPI002378D3D5|nr:type II toxin-antitoxin system HicB family antitoxin [Chelativorans sp. YIM 93263]
MDYAIVIIPLSEEDGGGYVGKVPDLVGCMSDGDTPEEALQNTREAITDWIAERKQLEQAVPEPGSAARRAAEERQAFADAIKQLAEHYDQRLDDLSQEIKEIQEKLEQQDAWARFSEITGLDIETNSDDVQNYC